MRRKLIRLKQINLPLIIVIMLTAIVGSYMIGDFVLKKNNISGFAWLGIAFVWGIVVFGLNFIENVHEKRSAGVSFLGSILDVLMLMTPIIILEFLVNYWAVPGMIILGFYTMVRLLFSQHPIFLRDKILEGPAAEIYPLDPVRKLIAETREDVFKKAMSKIKKAKKSKDKSVKVSADIVSEPVQKIAPLKLKGQKPGSNLPSGGEKVVVDEKLLEDLEKTSSEFFEPIVIDDEVIKILRQSDWEEGIKDPNELVKFTEIQVSMLPNEKFNINRLLSRKGLDEIPQRASEEKYRKMDSWDKIRLLMLIVRKDMAKIFNMKIRSKVKLSISFPWDPDFIDDSGREAKLSSKIKAENSWILNIRGDLPEDLTYALLATNLSDIWYDENANKAGSYYEVGFHFWTVYKLCLKRGYINMSNKSSLRNKIHFQRVRDLEEKIGEYGVFYKLVHNTFPTYTTEDLKEELKDTDKKRQKPEAEVGAALAKKVKVSAGIEPKKFAKDEAKIVEKSLQIDIEPEKKEDAVVEKEEKPVRSIPRPGKTIRLEHRPKEAKKEKTPEFLPIETSRKKIPPVLTIERRKSKSFDKSEASEVPSGPPKNIEAPENKDKSGEI